MVPRKTSIQVIASFDLVLVVSISLFLLVKVYALKNNQVHFKSDIKFLIYCFACLR